MSCGRHVARCCAWVDGGASGGVGDLSYGLRVLKRSWRSSCDLKGYSFCYIFLGLSRFHFVYYQLSSCQRTVRVAFPVPSPTITSSNPFQYRMYPRSVVVGSLDHILLSPFLRCSTRLPHVRVHSGAYYFETIVNPLSQRGCHQTVNYPCTALTLVFVQQKGLTYLLPPPSRNRYPPVGPPADTMAHQGVSYRADWSPFSRSWFQ